MLRSMIFNCNSTHPHPIVWGGVGWGGIITSLAFPHGLVLHWHFHMILMLRSMIFTGISTWTWFYALWPSIASPHELDATLYDLQLQFHTSASDSLGWGGVGWDYSVIGISTWTWCYALWSSLAFPHELDATLYDLHWHFHMILILCSMIFTGISTWTWFYALWSAIASPHELDATLYDLQLQFHTSASDSLGWGGVGWDNNVIGISTWTCSSLAFPHDLDATLYDHHWHFHMNLMLRSMTFNCNSTWTWCYALWSSIAIPHIRIR